MKAKILLFFLGIGVKAAFKRYFRNVHCWVVQGCSECGALVTLFKMYSGINLCMFGKFSKSGLPHFA